MTEVLDIKSDSFDSQVMQETDKLVLVDFYSPTCRPCKAMLPVLKQMAGSMAEKVKIVKVNTVEEPGLVEKLGVKGVPTLVLLKNGEELARKTGFVQPFQLRTWIEEQ